MKQELIITNDGSHTIFVPELNEQYHSLAGAIQESLHVYINSGFNYVDKERIRVLEIGFGTGLNALLTICEADKTGKKVYYESIEAYPLPKDVWTALNYNTITQQYNYFNKIHSADWDTEAVINEVFTLKKVRASLLDYKTDKKFDLIYFDAFAPDKQPDLWTKNIFDKMADLLMENGVLVTYSSKGIVKQNLRDCGFKVTRLKGAGGKHHMVRAIKI